MGAYTEYILIIREYDTTIETAELVVLMWGFSDLLKTRSMDEVCSVFNRVMARRRKLGKPFATHTDLRTQSEVIGDINHV